MAIYKRGGVYWFKFQFDGKSIRESTSQSNDKLARTMESNRKTELARAKQEQEAACTRLQCAEVVRCHECEKLFNAEKAIKKGDNVFCGGSCAVEFDRKHSMPTLREFLERFREYAKTKHKAKPATVRYYSQGCDMLEKSTLADRRLDELSDQHAVQFAAEHFKLSPSGINRGLRTLRRALNLAFQWNKLNRPVRVHLAEGENQRTRVLTDDEIQKYLDACPQPWRDCATIILDEGFRPGEVFTLRWPHVLFNEDGTGLIQIVDGKSKAARRMLPMTPRVYALLQARFNSAGKPEDDWVFPNQSACGHFNQNVSKDQHKIGLTDSGVESFPPYVLRHTALTKLGETAGGDVFVLAKIAGHSTIAITQRYIHPQADAIQRIFAAARVGTKMGTVRNEPKKRALGTGRQKALKPA